jgi:hypothetical protein
MRYLRAITCAALAGATITFVLAAGAAATPVVADPKFTG